MLKGLFEEKTEIESVCHLNDVELTIYEDEIIKRDWDGIPIVRELKSKGIKLCGSNDDTKIIVNITGDFKVAIQIKEVVKGMTNEEAIEILEELWRYNTTDKFTDDEIRKSLDMAIKALEQQPCEDVLDKIRTEIEQIADEEQKHDEKWAIGLHYAVKIIDKYTER